jgi:predicted dehydrogenase
MSKPLKVGLVGTGSISDHHMTAYLEHPERVRLTAVCDIDEALAKESARKAGVEDVYLNFDDMLLNADIDAVDICTGHNLHAPQAIAAAAAGKHVIVEKAMSTTLQDCQAMIEAADSAGVTLMVAQHLRYSPEAYAVKRLIDDGKLGEIQAVRTHVFRQGPPKSWYTDAKSGGGVLQLNTVHYIDLLRYYVGNVKRVTGVCRSVQPQMTNGAEDLVAATLEFDNGAIGDLFSSWTTSLAPENSSYMVLGSQGTLHSTPPATAKDDSPIRHFGIVMLGEKESDQGKLNNQPSKPVDTSDIVLPSTNFFVNEILHFEECIRTGSEPLSSGRDNIETMKVVIGILESSRTGKRVEMAELS